VLDLLALAAAGGQRRALRRRAWIEGFSSAQMT
jgi:hypothetical protein